MEYYNPDLIKLINKDILNDIRKIFQAFKKSNYEIYLVGGCVRDLLLSKTPEEYDFTTNARPDEVRKLFPRVIPTGIAHGTVTVVFKKNAYEITTYRSEDTYSDSRHPDQIKYEDKLEMDISRRDFTINGLAYDIDNHYVIDFCNGLEDLDNRVIRAIGKPKMRFKEDGLRSVRACRFKSVLGFEIEKETWDAIGATLENSRLVSIERFFDELRKSLNGSKAGEFLHLLYISGLWEIFLPREFHIDLIQLPSQFEELHFPEELNKNFWRTATEEDKNLFFPKILKKYFEKESKFIKLIDKLSTLVGLEDADRIRKTYIEAFIFFLLHYLHLEESFSSLNLISAAESENSIDLNRIDKFISSLRPAEKAAKVFFHELKRPVEVSYRYILFLETFYFAAFFKPDANNSYHLRLFLSVFEKLFKKNCDLDFGESLNLFGLFLDYLYDFFPSRFFEEFQNFIIKAISENMKSPIISLRRLAVDGNDIIGELNIKKRETGKYLMYALDFILREQSKNRKNEIISFLNQAKIED
jgi:tRNA nucleotidyltransferase/poly(A) polymerase